MNAERFDRLTRSLTTARPRRIVLAGTAGGLLTALGLAVRQDHAMGRRRRRNHRRRNRRRRCRNGHVRCGRRCRECCVNAHCARFGPLHVCQNHRCLECDSDEGCHELWGTAKPSCCVGTCRECCDDDDCTSPDLPACDGGACFECSRHEHCPSATPFCDSNACFECVLDAHCLGGFSCRGNRCVDDCDNGVRDGDESDIDCGGSCPIKCADGQRCFWDGDCQSGICNDAVCAAPATCETDFDCDAQRCHKCEFFGGKCRQACQPEGQCVIQEETDTIVACCLSDDTVLQYVRAGRPTGYYCCQSHLTIEECCDLLPEHDACHIWDGVVIAP